MTDGYTRRECLTALTAATVLGSRAARSVSAAPAGRTLNGKEMRGAFMIMATPFTTTGDVDWEDLANEVAFIDRSGCQGMVWPQGSSGIANLSKPERMKGMEVLAKAIQGKKAVLGLGIQGRDTAEMLEYANRAEALAPDAMICMPPKLGNSQDDYYQYFKALAGVTKRPVILQTNGGNPKITPTTDLIVQLAKEYPNFGYVKEESEPVVERMKELRRQRPPVRGIFGAELGQGWLYEMRLGMDGIVTGNVAYADLMARMWELHEKGKSEEVRDAYSKFLLMRNISTKVPGTEGYILHKRGVFKSRTTRMTASGSATGWRASTPELGPEEVAEIEYRFAACAPYLSQPATH